MVSFELVLHYAFSAAFLFLGTVFVAMILAGVIMGIKELYKPTIKVLNKRKPNWVR